MGVFRRFEHQSSGYCTFQHAELQIHYYNIRFTALWILSGTTRVIRHQKGKRNNLDLLEQKILSGKAGL